jgi:hypothetical protein
LSESREIFFGHGKGSKIKKISFRVYTGRFLSDDIDCHTDIKGRMACFPNKGFARFFPSFYFAVLHIALFAIVVVVVCFFCKVFS